jgi:hypothetical protein
LKIPLPTAWDAPNLSKGEEVIGWEWDEAVGGYMVHEKIGRAIYQKLYVIFKDLLRVRKTSCPIYRKLDCHALLFFSIKDAGPNQRVSPSALNWVS